MNWKIGCLVAAVVGTVVLFIVFILGVAGYLYFRANETGPAAVVAVSPVPMESQPTPVASSGAYVFSRSGTVYYVARSGVAEAELCSGRDPSLSPDGRWVACFRDNSTSAGGRFVAIEVTTRKETEIAPAGGALGSSSWSPGSDALVFTRIAPATGRNELVVWDRTAGQSRAVLTSDAMFFEPSWRADGMLVYHDMEHLLVVDLAGALMEKIPLTTITGSPDKVTSADRFVYSPTDRNLLAFTMQVDPSPRMAQSSGDLNTALFVYDFRTRAAKRLTPGTMVAFGPCWTRDGEAIFFAGCFDAALDELIPMRLWRVNRDGTALTELNRGESPGQ